MTCAMKRLVAIVAVSRSCCWHRTAPARWRAGAPAARGHRHAARAGRALSRSRCSRRCCSARRTPARSRRSASGCAATTRSKGTELQNAAVASGFDRQLRRARRSSRTSWTTWPAGSDWTTQLGQAFAADRAAVFASIQRLRAKAQGAGNLKTTPQQQVETQDDVGRRAGDRHRAGEPAGRLRAAIQPDGRLHAAVDDRRRPGEQQQRRRRRRRA